MNEFEKTILSARKRAYLHQRSIFQNRLDIISSYSDMVLKRVPAGKNVYYHVKKPGSKKFKYLGSDKNETVRLIKESRYIAESISRLDNNISCLETLLSDLCDTDTQAVVQSLPLTYRGNPITEPERQEVISKWQSKQAEIKAAYPIKNPEQLVIQHPNGQMFRSKSELSIALILDDHKVPYAYEIPVEIDGITFYPDFRILSPVNLIDEFLLEHFGRLDLSNYQQSVGFKIAKYMKIGFIPNNNFYMTYDVIGGGLAFQSLYDMISRIT